MIKVHAARLFSRSKIALSLGITKSVNCVAISDGASPFPELDLSPRGGDKNSRVPKSIIIKMLLHLGLPGVPGLLKLSDDSTASLWYRVIRFPSMELARGCEV